MTAADLLARGFVRNNRLTHPYTFCPTCQAYRWWVWWDGPQYGAKVTVCEGCGNLEPLHENFVRKYPAESSEVHDV